MTDETPEPCAFRGQRMGNGNAENVGVAPDLYICWNRDTRDAGLCSLTNPQKIKHKISRALFHVQQKEVLYRSCDECPLYKTKSQLIAESQADGNQVAARHVAAMAAMAAQSPTPVAAANPESDANLPPLIIRGFNFAKAMTKFAANGFKMCRQETIDARLAICQACPNLVDNHCKVCGCTCVATNQVMNKLAIASERCPEGKWDVETEENQQQPAETVRAEGSETGSPASESGTNSENVLAGDATG